MTNASPGSVIAQVECVRGFPVKVITGRLDRTNAPLFDAQAAPFAEQCNSGFQPLLDIYPDRETALIGSSA